ncbi:MAG: hypothetical protein ACT4NX_01710 [Deltaproteobacteria bacterium]
MTNYLGVITTKLIIQYSELLDSRSKDCGNDKEANNRAVVVIPTKVGI